MLTYFFLSTKQSTLALNNKVKRKTDLKNKCERKLKVYPKYLRRINGKIKIVSEIRLSGNWVCEYGFQYGQSVIITCEENKITITPYKNNKQ